jgi:hypothetical protein
LQFLDPGAAIVESSCLDVSIVQHHVLRGHNDGSGDD